MLEYTPSPYVSWIKHLSDYCSDSAVLVEKAEGLEVLVHPRHKPLYIPRTDSLYGSVDKEDKTVQLYFYSLAWVIPVLTQGDEERIAAALGLVRNIMEIVPEEERPGAWNMLWDDHAVCERLCVIIELLSYDLSPLSFNKDKLAHHLEKTYQNIEKLVASDRWLNNNHRLFHLLASFVYHHYKGDSEKVDEFSDHISSFCHDLIDVETGFAREQCISYCFFDINVVEKVLKTLSDLSVNVDFDVKKAHENLLYHVNAIAFPDSTLPASGDTPYGIKLSNFQKKYTVKESEHHQHWMRLERLGFYRGESEFGTAQFLMLEHNGESGHGHYSPLHVDLWISGIGAVLVDSGGPYKYGDKQRYNWFRASRGHNSLSFDDVEFCPLSKIHISMKKERKESEGYLEYKNAAHGRRVSASEKGFSIDEFAFSEKEWKVYYNFAPSLEIVEKRDDNRQITFENKEGRRLVVEVSSSEVFVDMQMTKRCIGHSLVDEGVSLVVSSSSMVTFYSMKIWVKV